MIIISKWLNSSIWPIEGILTVTTTPSQIEPRSNGNERVLHNAQNSRSEASPSDAGDATAYSTALPTGQNNKLKEKIWDFVTMLTIPAEQKVRIR